MRDDRRLVPLGWPVPSHLRHRVSFDPYPCPDIRIAKRSSPALCDLIIAKYDNPPSGHPQQFRCHDIENIIDRPNLVGRQLQRARMRL
jgi:hypothetical protein